MVLVRKELHEISFTCLLAFLLGILSKPCHREIKVRVHSDAGWRKYRIKFRATEAAEI